MPSPLDALRAAGFSDDEMQQWAGDQRQKLGAAGFRPEEIDAYLAGGVTVPSEPPKPLLERIHRGLSLNGLFDEIGEAERKTFMQQASAPPISPETEAWLRDNGIFNDPAKGQASPIRMLTEAAAKPIGAAVNVFGAAIGAGVAGFGAGIGGIVKRLGASDTESARAEREAQNLLNFTMANSMARGGPQMHMTRPTISPTGEVSDVTIGALPETTDFVDASKALAGPTAPLPVQQKMLQLYQERGLHPAEVAHDAASDVTITQDLASKGNELPQAYVAGPQPEPEPPPANSPTSPIRSFSPEALKVDAARFQFKGGGDQSGVTDRLQGITLWDPIKAGLGVAYEDTDGATYIVDGHQRFALARRISENDPTQQPKFNAFVLRAEDGISDADARAVAASKNIAEGTGTSVDAAKVLRDRPDLLGSLPPRSELVRQAQGLSKLSPDAFGMVVNDVVPPNYASIVGRLVPDDPKLQGALVSLLAKVDPANMVQAESIVRQGIDAGLHTETQASLFGDEEVVSSLYGERARILDRALKTLRRDRTVFQSIADNQAVIEELGNRLAQDENVKRAATDAQAVQILQVLANRRGILGDALTAAARSVADGGADAASATRDFVAELRRQAEGGNLTRIAAGGDGSPLATPSASATEQGATTGAAAPGVERDIHAIGPHEEARAAEFVSEAIRPTEPVVEQTTQGEQLVFPGAEQSAVQAAASREAEGHGLATTQVPQQEPGGLFAPPPPPPEPNLFERLISNEEGTVRIGRPEYPEGSIEAARQKIDDQLSVGEREPTRRWTFERLYTSIFDQWRSISRATHEIQGREAYEPDANNPYQRFRMLASSPGVADHFINVGTLDWETGRVNGQSLKEVLDPVKNNLGEFREFSAAMRAIELNQRGITPGIDLAAAQQVAEADVGRFGGVLDNLVAYQERSLAYLRDSGVLSSEAFDAMTAANRLYVPFNRVMDAMMSQPGGRGASAQANNPIRRILGSERRVIDPIESVIRNTYTFATLAEKNAAGLKLVDMLLAADRAELGVLPSSMSAADLQRAAAERTGRPTPELDSQTIMDVDGTPLPPRQQPLRGATAFEEDGPSISVGAADEVPPAVRSDIEEYLRQHGVENPEQLIDTMTAGRTPRDDEIAVLRNGRREVYRVDPDIAAAVKGLDAQTVGMFEKILSIPASFLRAGAVLTPEFWGRHIFRDYIYAAITSKGVFTPVDMAKGLWGTIFRDADYQKWYANGGANVSVASLDRRYLQNNIEKLTDTGLFARAWNVIGDSGQPILGRGAEAALLPFRAFDKFLLDPLRVGTEAAESASHLGAFKSEMRRMEADLSPGEELTRDQLREAAFYSRDIAVDAARRGAATRAYNSLTAFANITLQDTDRVVRAFVKNPGSTAMKIGLGIVLPSALLWWRNHDDPRYQELPQWQKDLFWIVPLDSWQDVGPVSQYGPPIQGLPYRQIGDRLQINNGVLLRLPKAWGMGVLFGSGTERLLSAFVDQNPEAGKRFLQSIGDTVIPQIVPTAAVPPIEQFANRSIFTNRTLVPDQMEKYLPEYQYTPYTTETAKALGRMIGAFPGMRNASISVDHPMMGGVARALSSPILIENYIRGWSGTLGVYALQAADLGLRKAGMVPDPVQPTRTLADIPIIRGFVARYPSATAASIQDFEDHYAEQSKYYDTWLGMAREGNVDAVQKIAAAGGATMFVRLDGIKKVLSEHNKLIRDIYKNPEIGSDQKRQLIDQLYYSMIQLGRAGKTAMQQADIALSPTSPTVH